MRVPFTNPPAPQPGPVRARRTWNSSPSESLIVHPRSNSWRIAAMLSSLWMGSLVLADVELRNGKLVYQTDTHGNRIPDFSYAGFQAGETPIPTIDAIVLVDSSHDDDTQAIQSAIDEVAKRKPNDRVSRCRASSPRQAQGSRNSTHPCQRHRLAGCGAKDSGTTLLATGLDRRSLIEVVGGRMKPSGIRSPWPIAIFHPTP